MKKILIVGDFIEGSGVTTFIFNTFGQIKNSNVQFTAAIVSGSTDCISKLEDMGWKYVVIPAANKNIFVHIKTWKNFLRQETFDAVHFNYSADWNFVPIYLCKKFGITTITLHAHNTFFGTAGSKLVTSLLKILHEFSKKIVLNKLISHYIAVSDDAAKWMFPNKIFRSKQFMILKNGVNIEKFKFSENYRNEIRKELEIDDSQQVFIQVGVFQPRKNQKFSVELFKRIKEKNENAILLFIGNGPDKSLIEELVNENELTNSVKFLGIRQDVYKLYSAADFLLMPSFYEGLSFVMIEAQVSGLRILINKKVPVGDYDKELMVRLPLNIEKWINSLEENKRIELNRRKFAADTMNNLGYNQNHSIDILKKIYSI
ncbi:glycosyltransferase [Paucilactobacillus sp. N302-9]